MDRVFCWIVTTLPTPNVGISRPDAIQSNHRGIEEPCCRPKFLWKCLFTGLYAVFFNFGLSLAIAVACAEVTIYYIRWCEETVRSIATLFVSNQTYQIHHYHEYHPAGLMPQSKQKQQVFQS